MPTTLASLEDQIIELTVYFPAGGHVDIVGRVRVIFKDVWVGTCCLPAKTLVTNHRPGVFGTLLKVAEGEE